MMALRAFAVLLELARVLPNDLNHEIRLVFFDAEDQGNLNNWEWIVGSTAYAASLDTKPEAVIIIDMIGDKDLKVVKEGTQLRNWWILFG